jgi:hypothetical protein
MWNGIRQFLGLKPVYTLNIVPQDEYTPIALRARE